MCSSPVADPRSEEGGAGVLGLASNILDNIFWPFLRAFLNEGARMSKLSQYVFLLISCLILWLGGYSYHYVDVVMLLFCYNNILFIYCFGTSDTTVTGTAAGQWSIYSVFIVLALYGLFQILWAN